MTRTTNARVAGFTFLFYIVFGISSMLLHAHATVGADTATKLATATQHIAALRLTIILGLLQCLCAITLGVTLHGMTKAVDADWALFAMVRRVGEGLVETSAVRNTLRLLWLVTDGARNNRALHTRMC